MTFQNPYMNPYFQPQQQTFVQPSQVIKVNGENGAMAYSIGANSSALLLDESGLMVWLVVSDGAGYKTVTPYDITPHQVTPAPDFGTLESRIQRLEEIVNGNTADSSATRRRSRSDDFAADQADDSNGSFRKQSSGGNKPAYADEPSDETGNGYHKGFRERS